MLTWIELAHWTVPLLLPNPWSFPTKKRKNRKKHKKNSTGLEGKAALSGSAGRTFKP